MQHYYAKNWVNICKIQDSLALLYIATRKELGHLVKTYPNCLTQAIHPEGKIPLSRLQSDSIRLSFQTGDFDYLRTHDQNEISNAVHIYAFDRLYLPEEVHGRPNYIQKLWDEGKLKEFEGKDEIPPSLDEQLAMTANAFPTVTLEGIEYIALRKKGYSFGEQRISDIDYDVLLIEKESLYIDINLPQ